LDANAARTGSVATSLIGISHGDRAKLPTILIVEDEPELARVLRSYLEQAGYHVISALRGDSGLALWKQAKPDLVLLDLNLPGMDGLDVARNIRRLSETPIIMLTARVEEADRLSGLDIGADDYVTKPFSPREVVARVRTVLRRSSGAAPPSRLILLGDLEIDLDAREASRSGEPLSLTATEFNLLKTFTTQPGRVFTRQQLLETSFDTTFEGFERTIDTHIKNLRAKLEIDPKNPRSIVTVFGVGYRFNLK